MTDLPPPDVMDQRGRARRLTLASLVGAAAAALAFAIANQLARPDELVQQASVYTQHEAGAYRFVYYVTGFCGIAAFIVTLKIANWRADKRWREGLVAQARVVKP